MTGKLTVWYPTDRFIEFVKQEYPDAYMRKDAKHIGHVELIIIPTYQCGSYDGAVGIGGDINGVSLP